MKFPGWVRIVVLLLLAPAAPGLAAEALTPLGEAVVVEVVDGDSVVLDRAVRGTRRVRLVGLQAPKLPLGRPGFPTWPLAANSKQALAALVLDKRVTLALGGAAKDRHGRLLAHLYGPAGDGSAGAWVQGAMLEAGMARVYTVPDTRARVPEMLAAERRARVARRGIWGDPFYAIRTPTNAARHVGTFQVVQGRVLDVARVKSRVYLNFGPDWRTDFTVTLDARARRLFKKAGIDPLTLKDRSIRVRGWLKRRNGPAIKATHPEQIEVLAE